WDSNPRTPARQGPQPCAFDLAWQPPPMVLMRILFDHLYASSLSCSLSCDARLFTSAAAPATRSLAGIDPAVSIFITKTSSRGTALTPPTSHSCTGSLQREQFVGSVTSSLPPASPITRIFRGQTSTHLPQPSQWSAICISGRFL